MELGNTMGLLGQLIEQNPDILNQIQSPQGVTPLPDPRFGAGRPTFGNILPDQGFNLPPVPNELMQNQPAMQPAMQQPVQNQMPVANSFLDQLQQSAGLLNEQVRNVVPQNQFVGNQFQMPYNFGGGFNTPYNPGTYTPGGYTPGQFNQYGNVPVTGGLPSNVSATATPDRGGNGPNQQDNQRYSYESFNGKSYKVDNVTGEVQEADLPFGSASLLGSLINKIPGVEDYRFENLPLNTQEQINNLVGNDPNSLRNTQGLNQSVKDVFGVDLSSNLTNEFNQALGLSTPKGLLDSPVNLNIPSQNLSLPTTPKKGSNASDKRQDNRGGVGDRNARQGSAASGANRGGAAGARS